MDLGLTEGEVREAKDWLDGQKVLNQQHLLVGMGVGSKMPAKIWPKERYALLGRYIIEQLGGVPDCFWRSRGPGIRKQLDKGVADRGQCRRGVASPASRGGA